MTGDAIEELAGEGGLANGSLHDGFVKVMTSALAGGDVKVGAGCGEDPLPNPFAGRAGVLEAQRVRKLDVAAATAQIVAVLQAYDPKVFAEWRDDCPWERRYPVLAALSVVDAQLTPLKIDVFDAQTRAFEEAQSGAIEQAGHEPAWSREVVEQRCNFVGRQDDWEPLRTLGAHEASAVFEGDGEHLVIEEEECRKGLVLGASADVSVSREVLEESLNLGRPSSRGWRLPWNWMKRATQPQARVRGL